MKSTLSSKHQGLKNSSPNTDESIQLLLIINRPLNLKNLPLSFKCERGCLPCSCEFLLFAFGLGSLGSWETSTCDFATIHSSQSCLLVIRQPPIRLLVCDEQLYNDSTGRLSAVKKFSLDLICILSHSLEEVAPVTVSVSNACPLCMM